MSVTIQDVLGQPYLTQVIQEIKTGLPDDLPSEFATTTEQIFGDRARSVRISGSRQLARRNEYGSAPRRLDLAGLSQSDLKFLHASEEVQINLLDYMNARAFASYSGVPIQKEVIDHQLRQLAVRFDNTRIATRYSALRNGKIWFDSNGYMQNTSSGAALEVDFGVPSANQNQISGIIDASWATASTKIVTHVNAIKDLAKRTSGYSLEGGYVLYGKNIPNYIATNTEFSNFWFRNPGYNQRFMDTGEIPDGVLGMKWRRMSGAFFNDANDSAVLVWGDDTVVFVPPVTADWWTMVEGSHPIPNSFQPVTGGTIESIDSLIGNLEFPYGKSAYGAIDPRSLQPLIRGFDTWMPWLKIGKVIFIADVTP